MTGSTPHLHDAIEVLPYGYAVYSEDIRLIDCNSAFATFMGRPQKELIGLTGLEIGRISLPFIESIDGEKVADNNFLERMQAEFEKPSGRPYVLELPDGRSFRSRYQLTPQGFRVFISEDITEAKKAESKVKEREAELSDVIEAQPTPIIVNDYRTKELLFVNPAANTLFGITVAEDLSLYQFDPYVDKEDREEFETSLIENGYIDNYEIRLRTKDKREIWAMLSSRRLKFRDRDAVVTSITDLTEQKKRESEIRRTQQRLEDAIESLSDPFAYYDQDEKLALCNTAFAEFYARQPSDLIGRTAEHLTRAIVPELKEVSGRTLEGLKTDTQYLMAKFRSSEPEDYELVTQGDRWFLVSFRSTRDGGRVSIQTEVSALKKMEHAVRESERRFRNIVESSPMPVVVTRPSDNKILFVSPAAANLFGLSSEDMLKMSTYEFVAKPSDYQRLKKMYDEEGSIEAQEIQMRRADGSVIPVILTSRAINYEDEPSSIIGIFDLSERKAAEHEIQSQREALHQSEKLNALGTLLAGVAHELNNPLSVVVGHSFLLADTAMDEKVKNRAEKIGKAAQRCSAIVKNFLAMARQSKQVLSEVDINGVISGTLEITGYVLKTAQIEIDTDLTKKLPSVWGDSDQIGQVVMNLVINAKQALETQEGQKRISIDSRISADKKSVVIGVSDNGPGVPEEAKQRIFDPFYTTKGVGIGTGLGLSVSRGIVEAHHGSIAVRNNTDNGAVFEVRLPISQGHDKERRSRPSSQTTTNSYSILIVDDDPEVMETLSELLEAQGHRVIQAESGAAALHLLSELDCDLILCDLRMPIMDGPELYRQVCRLFPHLSKRIAFVTGDILDPSSGDFLGAVNLPHLEKPFGPDEVQLTIKNLMDQ